MSGLVTCVFLLCAAVAAVAASGPTLLDNDVELHLFTRQNPGLSIPLLINPASVMSSTFNPAAPTVITIHNHGEGVIGNFNAHLVPAHIGAHDVNFVAIDWSKVSGMYSQGLSYAVPVAERISSFVNMLSAVFGYGPQNVRIVGNGLGAHIAGIVGDYTNGQISHVTAIDPSLIGWSHHPNKLKPGQAAVVEVIHVTAGNPGYDLPLGDLDFYPNGGSSQPSCGADLACSHILGYVFYAESISTAGGSRFVGTQCENYEAAVSQTCSGDKGVVFGGLGDKTGQSGIYSFRTNWQQPFAQG